LGKRNYTYTLVADIQAQLPIVEFDMAMANLRTKRNKIISKILIIYALADQYFDLKNIRTYRQALRDITENLTTVEQVKAVEFPTKP
jgi:hypothetical protein